MKKTFSKKKSAFSLIELSIVLIVIGLLIAGITGGASLIKSSELRSVMGEARGYAVAVNAFYSQFNALPGDYGTAVAGSDVLGDGDGLIEYWNSATAEGSEAWRDLKSIGAIDATLTYVSTATASQAAGNNLPSSKIKSSGWAFDNNTTSAQNVVVLTAGTVGTAGSATNTVVNISAAPVAQGAILAADALSIDSKIDDGVANLGKVRGVLAACNTNATYTVATAGKICALSYQVDVNS